MIPWLLVLERMCRTGQPLSALVRERMGRYPCSGEINRQLLDPDAAVKHVEARYQAEAIATDRTDGLSLEFPPGVSTCAHPTPNPSSASMSRPVKTRPCLRKRPPNSWP